MKIYEQEAKLIAFYGPNKLELYSYTLQGQFKISLLDTEGNIDNLIWYGPDIGSGDILGWDGTHFDNEIFKIHVDTITKHALEAFKKAV